MKSHLFGTIIPDAFIERLEKAADPAREGVRICVELIEELSTIPGVAGVHIMAPGNDAAIPEVITAARPRYEICHLTIRHSRLASSRDVAIRRYGIFFLERG